MKHVEQQYSPELSQTHHQEDDRADPLSQEMDEDSDEEEFDIRDYFTEYELFCHEKSLPHPDLRGTSYKGTPALERFSGLVLKNELFLDWMQAIVSSSLICGDSRDEDESATPYTVVRAPPPARPEGGR